MKLFFIYYNFHKLLEIHKFKLFNFNFLNIYYITTFSTLRMDMKDDDGGMDHSGMDMGDDKGMDSGMDHSGMDMGAGEPTA